MRTKLEVLKKKAMLSDPRIGGKSQLPDNITLPLTTLEEEGVVTHSPTLLFSIPVSLLNNLPDKEKYDNYYCSVFFNCDIENYEYISIMQDFYRDEYLATIVIIHEAKNIDRKDECFEPPYLLNIVNDTKSDFEWIQDEIVWDKYRYICELDTLEIDKLNLDINLTFDSAFGYLFIKDDWKSNENCGAFLLQTS